MVNGDRRSKFIASSPPSCYDFYYANLCILLQRDVTTGLPCRGKYKFFCCCFAFMMFCPVYGCNSSSKRNTEKKIHFFSFPKITNKAEEKRSKIWVDFCKRKSFVPSKYSGLCSLHFSEDAYVTSHSPQFLSTLNFQEKRKLHLKPDAVPTKNKPLGDCRQTKRHTGVLARRKVSTFHSIIMRILRLHIKHC